MTDEMKIRFQGLKKKHPDALLLFRANDTYQLFGSDAERAAEVLGLSVFDDDGVWSLDFPHFNLDTYLPKLIRHGFRVCIDDLTA